MMFSMSVKLPYFLLYLILCAHQGLSSLTLCQDRWVAFHGSCYLFGHENPLKFVEAEHYCRQHDGHLVHVNNATENAFLTDFAKSLKANDYWLGMTDETIEGVWEWYDTKSAVTYTHWHKGEPDDYRGEDCAIMEAGRGFSWNDVSCALTHQPLCETRLVLEVQRYKRNIATVCYLVSFISLC